MGDSDKEPLRVIVKNTFIDVVDVNTEELNLRRSSSDSDLSSSSRSRSNLLSESSDSGGFRIRGLKLDQWQSQVTGRSQEDAPEALGVPLHLVYMGSEGYQAPKPWPTENHPPVQHPKGGPPGSLHGTSAMRGTHPRDFSQQHSPAVPEETFNVSTMARQPVSSSSTGVWHWGAAPWMMPEQAAEMPPEAPSLPPYPFNMGAAENRQAPRHLPKERLPGIQHPDGGAFGGSLPGTRLMGDPYAMARQQATSHQASHQDPYAMARQPASSHQHSRSGAGVLQPAPLPASGSSASSHMVAHAGPEHVAAGDGQVVLSSLGAAKHESGDCSPCLFWMRKSCGKGEDCEYCHMRHKGQRIKRIRPSKKTRQRLREEAQGGGAGEDDNDDEDEEFFQT